MADTNTIGLGEYSDEDLIAELLNRNWEIVASKQPAEEKLDTRELTLKGEAHEKKSKTEDPGNNNRQH